MDINEMNIIIKERNARIARLEKLIYSMNLIGGASKNSFNYLAEKLLQQLENDISFEKMKTIIESELVVAYGLYLNEFDSDKITDNIMDWWKND